MGGFDFGSAFGGAGGYDFGSNSLAAGGGDKTINYKSGGNSDLSVIAIIGVVIAVVAYFVFGRK